MKSSAITRIVIWSIVLVMLAGILVAFICPWLIIDPLFYDDPPAETAIPVPLETTAEATPIQVLPNEEKLVTAADNVQEIEINWVAGDIIIMETDVDEITISESDVTDKKYSMVWHSNGRKLKLAFCEDHLLDGFGISFSADLSKDLYIEVPKGWEGHSIEIDAASANVEMHNITLKELDIDGASGTCDLQNCNIGDLDIDAASGSIYYSGILDSLDLDGASASFTADLQNTPSRIDMDSMSGSLDIALPEDCGYTLTMDGLSSTFRSDFHGTEMKNKSHIYGDGRCRIDVDGMSCEVTIQKLVPSEASDPACTFPSCTEAGEHAHSHTSHASRESCP